MSGGMNQRIAMAITLILGQEILLADEPTSALDATIQMQMAQELRHLRDVSGISQIIVTHNLALAEYLGDRIAVMYSGRVVELGEASTVLRSPRHPYTKSLIAAIPSLDGTMPVGLPGSPPMTGPSEVGCEFAPRCPFAGKDCADRAYALKDIGDGHFVSCEGGAR
jgi:oligopeptide/dipeptide ABC transporter ATP-binding protein